MRAGPTTVTGQLGNTSPIGNSGTPVSAGLTFSQGGGGLGGASIVTGGLGNGGTVGGGSGLGGGTGGGFGGGAGGFANSNVGSSLGSGGNSGGSFGGGLGGGFGGGLGGAGAAGGNAGGTGAVAPGLGGGIGGGVGANPLGGQPQGGPDGQLLDQQPGGTGTGGDPGAEGEGNTVAPGDQTARDEAEADLASVYPDDFSGQLAAFGSLAEMEAKQLATALMLHKIPA